MQRSLNALEEETEKLKKDTQDQFLQVSDTDVVARYRYPNGTTINYT